MSILDQYVIPLKGLTDGVYNYTFEFEQKFFDEFNEVEFRHSDIEAIILLEKRASLIVLEIGISGTIDVICDRCLDYFSMPVKNSQHLYLKLGQKGEDDDEETIFLSDTEQHISIAQYVYELVNFSIPLRKVHPKNSQCNKEMLKKLEEYSTGKEHEIDPRWEKLKNLLNN